MMKGLARGPEGTMTQKVDEGVPIFGGKETTSFLRLLRQNRRRRNRR